MNIKFLAQITFLFILIFSYLISCTSTAQISVSTPTALETTISPVSKTDALPSTPTPNFNSYEFPDSIDPGERYLFYLHGKIIEDQGLPAISPDFGEYQYEEILAALSSYGFVVISEQRPKDANGILYAEEVTGEVTALLEAGVPANAITLVGASKGAGITIYVSHYLENEDINFVLMGICHPDVVDGLLQGQISLYGNVLSIYDSVDNYAGSCQELFSYSEGKGLSSHDEIILDMGMGHGILYQPLDEWISPAVNWAKVHAP